MGEELQVTGDPLPLRLGESGQLKPIFDSEALEGLGAADRASLGRLTARRPLTAFTESSGPDRSYRNSRRYGPHPGGPRGKVLILDAELIQERPFSLAARLEA